MGTSTPAGAESAIPLDVIRNLARFHREHEKFYAIAPLQDAQVLAQASVTLKALADRWSRVDVGRHEPPASPFAGCEDLNDQTAIEMMGVLFMEGMGEPAELTKLREDLRARAASAEKTGAWLEEAMASSWEAARALLHVPAFADLLGERHRIIANNCLAADMSRLSASLVARAADILDIVDFTPQALRADLDGPRLAPGYLYSAAELLDRAADLAATSTTLTRDSEPAWRNWTRRADRLAEPTATAESAADQ